VLATGSAIEKTDHDAGALDATTVKAATCTEEGYTGDTKCTVCNTVVKAGSKTDKIAHTPATDATTAKDATCTADGKEADVICTVCGETITAGAAIPATGHSYGEDGYCTKCGKLNPELCAHDGDTEIANAADATCTEAGYTGDTVCSICDEVLEKGEAILAKGHDEGKLDETTVKAATCTEAGYTGDVKCTVCGEVVTAGTEIAATGHTYVDGVCSVCGEKDPSVAATEETEAPEEAGATEASEEAGATEASEEAGATEATEVESPETGDHASVAALAVAVVSAMGIALVASKKKFNA
jgi:hypothetical protein